MRLVLPKLTHKRRSACHVTACNDELSIRRAGKATAYSGAEMTGPTDYDDFPCFAQAMLRS